MKKILFLLLLACCAALNAEDCVKNSDACTAGSKTMSPFLAASALPKQAAAAPVKRTALAGPAAAQAAAEPAQPQVPAPEAAKTSSSPLWLLFVGGGFVGLYFYLGGKRKKGKK